MAASKARKLNWQFFPIHWSPNACFFVVIVVTILYLEVWIRFRGVLCCQTPMTSCGRASYDLRGWEMKFDLENTRRTWINVDARLSSLKEFNWHLGLLWCERSQYKLSDLGPTKFRMGSQVYTREENERSGKNIKHHLTLLDFAFNSAMSYCVCGARLVWNSADDGRTSSFWILETWNCRAAFFAAQPANDILVIQFVHRMCIRLLLYYTLHAGFGI